MKDRLNVMVFYPAKGKKADGSACHQHPENPPEHHEWCRTHIRPKEILTQERIKFQGTVLQLRNNPLNN
jgi:hypothetical protein